MSKLIIAIPSKGRLQENTHAFFGRAGLQVLQPGGARNYRGAIKGLPSVEIAFLSASEIARELADGSVHFGITGLDLVEENIADPAGTVHENTAALDRCPDPVGELEKAAHFLELAHQSFSEAGAADDLQEVAAAQERVRDKLSRQP